MLLAPVSPAMHLRNRRGDPIDPVPFFVSVSVAFLFCYSFVPATLLEIGLSVLPSLVATTTGFCFVSAVSYQRLVWTANPEIRAELPVGTRLRGILYAVFASMAVLGLLVLVALLG